MTTDEQPKPETECPECAGPIDWIVVRGTLGKSMYNGLCEKCCIVLRDREVPDVTRGKILEKDGKVGDIFIKDIGALDKRITSLPGDVQIGILRERHRVEKKTIDEIGVLTETLRKKEF